MKKILHTFAFMAMMLPLANGSLWAQVDITIGSLSGATDDPYLPANSLYNYSYTQQIYDADEIGMAGTINSITVWMYGNENLYEMPFAIYMVEVDKETFDSNTDWVTVTADDLVYTGSVTVHNTEAEAYTFALDVPFEYSGTGNLMIAVNNTTGNWRNGLNGKVFGNEEADAKAIYARQDGNAYDPYDPTFSATSTTALRNVITLNITPAGSVIGGNSVTIGSLDGATDDPYLPANSLYSYSYTQQIYDADEIGMAGTINSITVWMYGNENLYEMPFAIYMVEVYKETFDSNTDWVTVTADDLVYTGSVTVHNTEAEAYTFELDVPFEYSGTGNLMIAVNNTTGDWRSGLNGKVFGNEEADAKAIYARQDGNAYDPYTPTFSATSTTALRNVITLNITPAGSVIVCDPVTDVTVSNVTDHSATVAWNAPEGQIAWEVDYGTIGHTAGDGTIVTADANPYELTGLEQSSQYDVYVRAVCDNNVYSDWSAVASINTLDIHDAFSSIGSIFPNPASSNVTISGIDGEATVMVVDMNGRTVFTAKANEKLTIDLAGFAQGAYFVRISGERIMAIRKLIVK